MLHASQRRYGGYYQEPKILVPRNLISPLRVFLGTMITSGLYLTSSLRTVIKGTMTLLRKQQLLTGKILEQ
ncbi:hypothetical protein ANTRET_LOCUS3285 [Anthophora retusa]